MKPLLTLVMMVKNEADCIETTLATAKPYVDQWLVYDTGSTDGTQDLARAIMAGLPGRVVDEPFRDMSFSRNRALEWAGTDTEFLLLLDADDQLEGGPELRVYLEASRDERSRSAFFVRTRFDIEFDMCKVVRAGCGWRFEGVAHEQLVHPELAVHGRIPGVLVNQPRTPEMDAKSRSRWERELLLLRDDLEANPGATRSAFYLAQTLTNLGRHEEALEAHYFRIGMGGWWEEVYQSWIRVAYELAVSSAPWSDQMEALLEAYKIAPHRAEPLYRIGDHYRELGDYHLAYLFARRAAELPYPEADQHLIDQEVYAWQANDLLSITAFYVGDFEAGQRAARAALAARPDDGRLQENLKYYDERSR